MRNQRLLVYAISISLGAHLLFLGYSQFYWIPGVSGMMEHTKKMFHVTKIEREPQESSPHQQIESYIERMKFQKPQDLNSTDTVEGTDSSIEGPDISSAQPVQKTVLKQTFSKAVIVEQTLKAKQKADAHLRKVTKDDVITAERFDPKTEQPGGWTVEDIIIPDEFKEDMFAFTPAAPSQSVMDSIASQFAKVGKASKVGSKYVALDRFINVTVATWRDPSDHQGYYKISITPGKDAAILKSIPKEMIFLVDASLSIKEARLDEFIKGISYCLRNLNKGDRFSILTFKDEVDRFHGQAITAEDDTIKAAIRFLHGLQPSERTDIYAAFLDTIRTKETMLPSYIMLMSDGRATYGTLSSAKIISEISKVNALKRSIFTFSGGAKVNRYLLDFLAYQNRGWSEYAPASRHIDKRISEFYDKIRDPLLLNLHYQLSLPLRSAFRIASKFDPDPEQKTAIRLDLRDGFLDLLFKFFL